MVIENSIFAVQGMKDPPWHPEVTVRENEMILLPQSDYLNPGMDSQWWQDWAIAKPGPSWLNYEEHPATQDIPKVLSPQLLQ